MATIASLAIKITANIKDIQSKMDSVNNSVANVAKAAEKARPDVKNLTDAVDGLGEMYKSLGAAQERVGTDWLGGFVDEQVAAIDKIDEGILKLNSNIKRIGEGVADDILNLKPTLENVYAAQAQIQKLEALKQQLAAAPAGAVGGGDIAMLDSAIEKAKNNAAALANNTASVAMQMETLKSAIFSINNLPFQILAAILKDIWDGVSGLWGEFNKTFNGTPGLVLKTVAVISSLIVVIGLMNTQMIAVNGAVTYFRALWASSLIAQGLQGFITMLNTMLGTQLALNAATMLWIGMFTLGIAAAVAAVYLLYQRWTDTSDAIAQSESRVAALTDRMEEVVAAAKKINDSMVQSLNEMMTPLDKYKQKLDEIKAASGQKFTLALDMKDVSFEMQDIAAKMSKTKDESALAAYSGQISELQKQFKALKEQQKIAAGFSDADIAAAKAKALEDYRSSLGIVKTDAELLAEQTRKLTDGLAAGAITQNEFNSLIQSAKEKYDPATKAQIQAEQDYIAAIEKADEEMRKTLEAAENARKQLLDKEIQAREQLIDKFRQMANDSPVAKFLELKEQLESVRDSLSRTDFSAAMDKLQSDLAGGLGIKEFLTPEQSPAEKLADIYKKLEAYADKINDPFFDLAAAKQRAADKLMPKEKEKEPDKESPEASSQNQAAVKGTLAYFEAQNKANQPMLTESKKQTAALTIIAGNTKPKPAETPFEIQAV